MEMKDVSLALYHHMCKHVVGTENHIKTIRLMNTVCDSLSSEGRKISITSGSFGEGLEMCGSDLDMMYVLPSIEVHENTTPLYFNPSKTYISLLTEDTKPGFAMLRLISSPHPEVLECCEKFRKGNYLSNVLFKTCLLNDGIAVVHGPCVSDTFGLLDLACCLHSKSWLKPASRWIIRSDNSWPHQYTKQMIIRHGVLFVPIGCKGSSHEELEWRMSFSVGEKLLIYTFSHTQLLCYALMKILLKDVINADGRCKDLLCSYYLKTILFWISEELQPSVWTPDNLIPSFMRYFRRLIYCVQYQVCPHYFIPEQDLFENKINRLNRYFLTSTLYVLLSYGWRCILFSKQLLHIPVLSCNFRNDKTVLNYEDINKLLNSNILLTVNGVAGKHKNFSSVVNNILAYKSKKLKNIYSYFMSVVCNKLCQSIYLSSTLSNKIQYIQHNDCMAYLLMNFNHDTVSGWLMLASFFYKENHYKESLRIIVYSLSKCTPDKIFRGTELSDSQRLVMKWHLEQKQGIVRSLKFELVDYVMFAYGLKTFIPKELLIEAISFEVPPVVYAHFLSFLCHHHLQNVQECLNSLQNLQLTIVEDYFIGDDIGRKSVSYYCLGTALHLMGDYESAKDVFTEIIKMLYPYPFLMKQFKRLSLIDSL